MITFKNSFILWILQAEYVLHKTLRYYFGINVANLVISHCYEVNTKMHKAASFVACYFLLKLNLFRFYAWTFSRRAQIPKVKMQLTENSIKATVWFKKNCSWQIRHTRLVVVKSKLTILHKMAKEILVFCAALAVIVSLSQGLSYRPPTKDDCLCQCDPYVSYQQYGSPQGNCRRYWVHRTLNWFTTSVIFCVIAHTMDVAGATSR